MANAEKVDTATTTKKAESRTVKFPKSKAVKKEVKSDNVKLEDVTEEGIIDTVDIVSDKTISPVEENIEPPRVDVANGELDKAQISESHPDEVHKSQSTNKAYVPKPKFNKNEQFEDLNQIRSNYGNHVVNIALIIKNNAEIRRFTALGIINYLTQKGLLPKDVNKYVSFKWDIFIIKFTNAGGKFISYKYDYSEPFFLNCLVASFASFSAAAQKTIDTFTSIELDKRIGEAVDMEDVDEIVTLNELNASNKSKE